MEYDSQGRLHRENITYAKGKGEIEYTYFGNTTQLRQAKCQDNFFDKVQRLVSFRPMDQ